MKNSIYTTLIQEQIIIAHRKLFNKLRNIHLLEIQLSINKFNSFEMSSVLFQSVSFSSFILHPDLLETIQIFDIVKRCKHLRNFEGLVRLFTTRNQTQSLKCNKYFAEYSHKQILRRGKTLAWKLSIRTTAPLSVVINFLFFFTMTNLKVYESTL